VALGSTQPLTEMSTRSISLGKGGWCVRLTTLPPSSAVIMEFGNFNFPEPSGPLQACNGLLYLYLLYMLYGVRWLNLEGEYYYGLFKSIFVSGLWRNTKNQSGWSVFRLVLKPRTFRMERSCAKHLITICTNICGTNKKWLQHIYLKT
jgi:hypothetical protein